MSDQVQEISDLAVGDPLSPVIEKGLDQAQQAIDSGFKKIEGIAINFIEDEANKLLSLIDSALKHEGLKIVHVAAYMYSKISNAFNKM